MILHPTPAELWARMSEEAQALCRRVAAVARQAGYTVYLVGGSVRDLILGSGLVDLDIVVEGDAVLLAKTLGHELKATVHGPSQFLTAVIDLPNGRHLDLATARQESYPEPAKLPTVTPATIDQDLRRRDFTINAIALGLTESGVGPLIDPCKGLDDLGAGVIRILHARSYIDDPTRVIRAARFAERLGFQLDQESAVLLQEAVQAGLLCQVTGARVREEVIKLLKEPEPSAVLRRLVCWGAYEQVLGVPAPPQSYLRRLTKAQVGLAALQSPAMAAPLRRWPYMLGALVTTANAPAVAKRLELDREARDVVLDMSRAYRMNLHRWGSKVSVLADQLDGASLATRLGYWLQAAPATKARIERYLGRVYGQSAEKIDGHDLEAEGVQPGPAIAIGLRAARDVWIDCHASPKTQLAAAFAAIDQWRRPARTKRRRSKHTG
ncbi:MAG: CCA tRNA nucleotidyltransferase [Candidatus Zipacnadales bacterium]